MGLFDNLFFKTKTSAEPEEVAATTGKASNPEAGVEPANAVEPAQPALHKPPNIPAPSAFAPRSLGHVVTPGRAQRGGLGEPRHKEDARIDTPATHEIVITLGDVLDRLPSQVLTPGPHDPHRELRFQLDALSADIARGRAAIPLSQIAAQCPDLFRCQISEEDDVMVRLPLQKLVDQIGPLESRSPVAPAPLQPHSLPPLATGEATIKLRLSAILRTCPREILDGALPIVGESETIKFPFAPIERQLPNGRVDVSSGRFIAALPPHLHLHFRAIEGVRVPLPLDEIFLNLPDQKMDTPVPSVSAVQFILPVESGPMTPNVVLAPLKVAPAIVEPPSVPPSTTEAPKLEEPTAEQPKVEAPEPSAREQEPPASAAPPPPDGEVSQAEIDDLRARIAALRAEIGVAVSTPVESAPPPPPIAAIPPPPTPPPPRLAPASVEVRLAAEAAEPIVAQPIFRSPLMPPVVVNPAAIEEAKVVPPKVEPPPPVMLPVRKPAPPVVRPHVAPPRLFSALETVPLAEVHPFEPAPAANVAPEPPPPQSAPELSPPPPLSLDLEPARAALGLAGPISLEQLGAHLAALPGLHACVVDARHESANAGAFPAELDPAAVRARCAPLAAALNGGDTQHLTLFAEPACISLFACGHARLAVLHRARVFLPGVGEKLHATIEALARA